MTGVGIELSQTLVWTAKKGQQMSSRLQGELEDRKVIVGAIVLVFLHTIVNIREYILVREK